MKHIKTFETLDNKLISGMMCVDRNPLYPDFYFTLGYVGKIRNRTYQFIFVDFTYIEKDDMKIGEYKHSDYVTPLNISIKDYIFQKDKATLKYNYIDRCLKFLKEPRGGSNSSKKLVKKFYDILLKDEDIQLYLTTKKYNL